MLILLILFITITYQQPCSAGTDILTTSKSGICVVDATSTDYIEYQPSILDGLDAFTITLWFRPLTKASGRTEQALFRISADTSDVTLSTVNGVRLGMYFTADADQATQISIRYSKSSTNSQQFIQGFSYVEEYWCFAVAGLSYPAGKVFYYAWQPSNPSLQIHPQPVSETTNFHTALPPTTVLQLLYWGDSYKRFCGDVNTITIYSNYLELDYKHNWINLAFLSATYTTSIVAAYRLEEGSGQELYDQKQVTQTALGYLGSSTAVEATLDPTWQVGFLQFGSGQYAVIPAIAFPTDTTIFGVSFWFRTNAGITGDGDSTDLQKDLVVMKRKYQGSTEVFGIMFYTASGTQYGTKVKLNGIIYNPSSIIHLKDQWHYMTVTVMYPNSISDQNKIMYDISLEDSVFDAHQTTSQTNIFQQSTTDTIILGDSSNGFTNYLQLSNIKFYNKYTIYLDEDNTDTKILNCPTNCQIALNSLSSQYCLYCNSNLFDDGQCISTCVAGANALSNTLTSNSAIKVCRSCDYKCTTCATNGNCSTCRSGFFLLPSGIACDLSANCGGTYIGNPNTGSCTQCGNGSREAGEACDDGNFVSADGCSNCVVDTTPTLYKCTGNTPDVCVIRCGDGVLDAGAPAEACDDGNRVSGDGCSDTCLIEATTHSCNGASPTVCTKLCGNGVRAGTEACDDGNYVDNDGCSSACLIEIGYECNTASPNVCTRLCGNGVKDAGEQCDDGNTTNNDGCSDCVVDQGWNCDTGVCVKVCGNGVRDTGEECDDGNIISDDGCSSQCKVETDYFCKGGSSTTKDVCTVVPDLCGDGIKKSTEECDDGNSVSGDGCSKICKIEFGYLCTGGSTQSKDVCTPICGDGKKLDGVEKCDDGNTYGGDGCNEECQQESLYLCSGGSLSGPDKCVYTCGNGVRDDGEQCDDDNSDSGDGCSSDCQVENGYGCIEQTQSHDQCFKCVENCANCSDSTTCTQCYTGYFYLNEQCFPGCPFNYRSSSNECVECETYCAKCTEKQCLRCDYDHYLLTTCYSHCPEGYYDSPNAEQGNQCVQCTSPCSKCTQTECSQCGNGFYIEEGQCKSCDMGQYCEQCDHKDGVCLRCSSGYYRSGRECLEIPSKCGDGLHYPQEVCDDGNTELDDGCDNLCKVEDGWDCVLYDPQGPDVCFRRQAPQIKVIESPAFDNVIYIEFNRPMKQGIDFNNITNISVPDLDKMRMKEREDVNDEGVVIMHDLTNQFIPYSYELKHRRNRTLQITFTYGLTVSHNIQANITFFNASTVQDIYNWSLIASTKRLLQVSTAEDAYSLQTYLPYCIHYDSLDQLTYSAIAWFTCIVAILALISAFVYQYLIGEGRVRKTLEFIQYTAALRYVNVRIGLNLKEIFEKLNYFNIVWMFNILDYVENPCDQYDTEPRFQEFDYNSQFISEAGGRFLTAFIGLIILLGIVFIIYQFLKQQTIEYYSELILKFFQFQGFIIFTEIFFLDIMISAMLQLRNANFDYVYGILSFIFAILILFLFFILAAMIQRKLIINPRVIRIKEYYDHFGALFDGLLFTTSTTKFYALIPYIQKLIYAIILVFVQDPLIQIPIIAINKLMFYSFSVNIIPIYYIELFMRDVAYDSSFVIITLCLLAFRDSSISKTDKVNTGWGILSVVLLTLILQILWVRYAYQIIDRMQPAEVEDHVEIKDEKPKQGADLHILQQAVEMQQLENDFFNDQK